MVHRIGLGFLVATVGMGCGGGGGAASAPSTQRSASPTGTAATAVRPPRGVPGSTHYVGAYRLVSAPLILLTSSTDGSPAYDISIHLNRAAPPADMDIHLEGAYEPEPVSVMSRSHHCYSFGFVPSANNDPPDPRSLFHPRIGRTMHLELEVHGRVPGQIRVRVPLAGRYPTQVDSGKTIRHLAGC